jgi:hypothetical protein
MLLAKVKPGIELLTVVAFGGHEFVGYESRPVPEGAEAEALAHPFLDVQEEAKPAPQKQEEKEEKPAAVKKPSGKKEG